MNLAPLVQSSTTNAAKEKEAARKKFTPVETFTAPSLEAQGRIIGNIAAGNLADGDTIPQDIRLYRELEKGEYLLRVNGHSMEPSIPDGSVVYVNRDPLKAGDVGIFCVDGDIFCKQYYKDPAGTVYLFSLNRARADADVVLTAGSGRTLACFGRVILHALPLPGRT